MSMTYAAIPTYGIPTNAIPKYGYVGIYVIIYIPKSVDSGIKMPYSGGLGMIDKYEPWLPPSQLLIRQRVQEDKELIEILVCIIKLL